MMPSTDTLIKVASCYRDASGARQDTTVSHRVFGDSKKIASLRAGADITIGRFNAAMTWFVANWPEGWVMPAELLPYGAAPVGDLGNEARNGATDHGVPPKAGGHVGCLPFLIVDPQIEKDTP